MRVTISVREIGPDLLVEIALPRRPTEQVALVTATGKGFIIEKPGPRVPAANVWASQREALEVVLGGLVKRLARTLEGMP